MEDELLQRLAQAVGPMPPGLTDRVKQNLAAELSTPLPLDEATSEGPGASAAGPTSEQPETPGQV
ncbi:hypothetical protein [Kitasatospora sp. P5_F3]